MIINIHDWYVLIFVSKVWSIFQNSHHNVVVISKQLALRIAFMNNTCINWWIGIERTTPKALLIIYSLSLSLLARMKSPVGCDLSRLKMSFSSSWLKCTSNLPLESFIIYWISIVYYIVKMFTELSYQW